MNDLYIPSEEESKARGQQDPIVYCHSDLDHQVHDGPVQPTAADAPCT